MESWEKRRIPRPSENGFDGEACPSLFIVALPRTLSTLVHRECCAALDLRSPRWASSGEILNGDRVVISAERPSGENPKFTPPEARYASEQLDELLDDVVVATGRAYKDVVQPFAVARWLAARDMPILRIRRSLVDIAWSMQRAGWWYPEQAATTTGGDRRDRLLAGLLRASRALDALPAEVVEFDDLLASEERLRTALRRLYPGRDVPPLAYADEGFRLRSRRMLAERQDPLWRELAERLAQLADEPVEPGPASRLIS
ncbi:MAG TPA: hypothetical protein VIE43_08930 [Thermoanaerobaculia bacterium]|nr:hypothetical protein [Thermoanaerobaculia bacterium]